MIIDDIIAIIPEWKREQFSNDHVIRVPFPLPELHILEEGLIDFDTTKSQEDLKMFTPETDGGFDVSWANPPFKRLWITGIRNTGCAIHCESRIMSDGRIIVLCTLTSMYTEYLAVACAASVFEKGRAFDLTGKSPINVAAAIAGARKAFGIEVSSYFEENLINMWSKQPELFRNMDEINTTITAIAVATFSLMNCKNVTREEVMPDAAIQRKRARRGQPPLVRYHVLKVTPIKVKRRSKSAEIGSGRESTAIHWARGHFKTYTELKPLFGTIVGRFWWQPHLRGQGPHRVEKSYEIPDTSKG